MGTCTERSSVLHLFHISAKTIEPTAKKEKPNIQIAG